MANFSIFVDFWNFQLSVLDITSNRYSVDWKKLPNFLVNEVKMLINQESVKYLKTKVYISYNSHSDKDKPLAKWAKDTLSRFPGIEIDLKERKPKGPVECPECRSLISQCPSCGKPIKKTIEKGVDSQIVCDMMGMMWDGVIDSAVLLSSDRDFIPVVNYLSSKGYRVINAYFPPDGIDLAQNCWANIDLKRNLNQYKRKITKRR